MKKALLFLFLPVCLSGFISCNCPEEFPIEEENLTTPFQVISYSDQQNEAVFILLNKPVDTSNIIVGKNLRVEGQGVYYTGYYEYYQISSGWVLSIPQCEVYCNNPDKLCKYNVVLDGNGLDSPAFQSETGQALDGDNNNSDGGVFSEAFETVYCDVYALSVTNPIPGTGTFLDPMSAPPDKKIVILVTFSENMNQGSVKPGQSIYMLCVNDNSVKISGTITWVTRNTLQFVTEETYAVMKSRCLLPGITTQYKLVIKASGPDAVKSVYGIPLDPMVGPNGPDFFHLYFLT